MDATSTSRKPFPRSVAWTQSRREEDEEAANAPHARATAAESRTFARGIDVIRIDARGVVRGSPNPAA
jgi:hypothetical protein